MTDLTAQQLVTQIERAIYQSAGSAVQIYSEDLLLDMVQQAFSHIFDLRFWPRFNKRETLTLDGTTGQTTVAPAYITEYRDIMKVFPGSFNRGLPILPNTMNTINITSGAPRFIEPSGDSKLIRVWPINATGTIQLLGRARPAKFVLADTVPFDDLLITHFAAWSYFADDASSPGATDKHQALFERRLSELMKTEFTHVVQLDTNAVDIPNRWSEYQ